MMKKIFVTVLLFCLINTIFAQKKPVKKPTNTSSKVEQNSTVSEKRLGENITTIDELKKVLVEDYTMMENTEAVGGITFKMAKCIVLTEFMDASAIQQAKNTEKEFGTTFNGSIWKFDPYKKNIQLNVVVTASSGQSANSTYTPSGAIVRMGQIIDGLDIQAYIYQSKKDKNRYIMLFPIQGVMLCASDLIKQ